MAGGLVSKPRSKELSRLSSEPGMKGSHTGSRLGKGARRNQGIPREGRGLGQIKAEHPRTDWESMPHSCVQGAGSEGSTLTAGLFEGSLGYPRPQLVNECYARLGRPKAREVWRNFWGENGSTNRFAEAEVQLY